jgi:glycosyltransferase involved in cell wall biosynthesis
MKILWIPHAGWRIPQRAHLFCHALAERHEVHVTDWVADFSTVGDYFSKRYLQNYFYRISRENNLTVHRIPRISPAIFSATLRAINARVFSGMVRGIIERYQINVVVGTFVVPPPRTAPRLIFDLFDENVGLWLSGGRFRRYAEEISAHETVYLESADSVVAASSVLAEKARSRTSRPVFYIPNGVDFSSFQDADGRSLRAEWNPCGPVIGNLGNHDTEAELDKVLDAARLLAEKNLTFIIAGRGKALPSAVRRVRKEGIPNVRFIPSVPFHDAPTFIQAFDVGLCPYTKTLGSDERSPMRLLMYAAGGLPTVCTELEEVRRMGFPNVILVRDNPQDLAKGILRALTLPRKRPEKVKAFDIEILAAQYEKVLAS